MQVVWQQDGKPETHADRPPVLHYISENGDNGADRHTLVKILNVFIQHPDAPVGNRLSD